MTAEYSRVLYVQGKGAVGSIALMTPPAGACLFVAYVPEISLFLPRLLGF